MFSLRRLRQAGARIIVIDHHPSSPLVDAVVDVHINPHRFGFSGDLTAGMLCSEIGHILRPSLKQSFVHLAAVSSVADKSSITDYANLTLLSPEELEKISYCVDFEAFTVKFADSDPIRDVLFGKKEVLELLWAELEKRTAVVKTVASKYALHRTITLENTEATYITLDLEKAALFDYPGNKITSIAHGLFSGPRITFGIGGDFVTVRADQVPFSFVALIDHLREEFPYAAISGGGHPQAGTLKFVPGAKDDVLREIRKFLQIG